VRLAVTGRPGRTIFLGGKPGTAKFTFTPRQRFLNTLPCALSDHGMPLHKLPHDLPPVRAHVDLHGKPALLAPAIQKAGQDRLPALPCQSPDGCAGGPVRIIPPTGPRTLPATGLPGRGIFPVRRIVWRDVPQNSSRVSVANARRTPGGPCNPGQPAGPVTALRFEPELSRGNADFKPDAFPRLSALPDGHAGNSQDLGD